MARKLFRVTATIEAFIIAEEGEEFAEAPTLLEEHVKNDGLSNCDDVLVVPIDSIDDVPEEWRDSIPFSELDEDDEMHDFTCAEFLARGSSSSDEEEDDADEDEDDEAAELDFSA